MFRDPLMIDRARKLRRGMTIAENKLWSHLRRKQLDGHRFRRQVPLGNYIVDFACLQARLIIELDGVHHDEALDARRTDWLVSRGYRVLRFTNVEVRTQTNRVLEVISKALSHSRTLGNRGSTSPQPLPSPCGGGD